MSHGSPIWQTAIFFAALVFLLWQIWRGWHAGFGRRGMHFAAVAVSLSLGCLAAKLAAMPFGGIDNLSGLMAGAMAGGALGFSLLVALWLLAAVLFRRRGHQGSVQILWGTGGAFFGLLFGLAILWGDISIVRSLGAFAESRVDGRMEDTHRLGPDIAGALVALKESLELGPAGRVCASLDMLSPDFYQLVFQIGRLTSDQRAMLRFLEYPGLQGVLENPRIVDLLDDPGVIQASQEGNIFLLFGNKAVAAAITDPVLSEQLNKIDLRAALKFALESPPPSPAPSEAPPPAQSQ